MRNSMSKTIVAGLAALAMSAAVILPTTPASAQWRGGGGWHGGGFGGGWHGGGFGGGWHGGGWRGGGWGGGWRGGGYGGGWRNAGWGYGGYGGWNGRYYNGCRWGGCGYNGWGWGLATGALLGAAATYPYWGGDTSYTYGNDNGCWEYRRSYNRHGHYIGRHLVNVCY